ncbi:MAG: glycosyltransferase [Patescibacteria group bacterium]|nr:glycosyltransferase [Patescibacteria group bacterium]
MKILFITPSPPNNLNRIRSKNIIIEFYKLGYDITLVSLLKSKKESKELNDIKKYVNRAIGIYHPKILSWLFCCAGLFLPIPLRVAYCFSLKMKKTLKKLSLEKFDCIYIKRLRMAQYARLLNQEKIFIDITDSMTKYYNRLRLVSRGVNKLLAIEEYFKHGIYEQKICNTYKNIIICSNDDREYLISKYNCNKKHFIVLENGINIDYWCSKEILIKKNRQLAFFGVMNVDTNKLSCEFFIKDVMPLLSKDYKLNVIGPSPDDSLIRYSSDRVHFSGFVNDIRSELKKASIFVCPMISGAGTKNKILQVAAIGLPIISTNLGIEGINKELKKMVFIANSPEEFVSVINLIDQYDKNQLGTLLRKQKDFVKYKYNTTRLISDFVKKHISL